MAKFPTATPGIVIITPLKKEESNSLTLTQKTQGRIIKGTIVAMGADDMTQNGTKIPAALFGKVGDVVWFLHYYDEGMVDQGEIDGQLYFFVKFGDIRARE